MMPQIIRLDVDHVGSQDPADQPTAEEWEAISRYFQAQKQRRAAEAARQLEATEKQPVEHAA